MTENDKKVIAISKIVAGTKIDAGQLATLLNIMGKLSREDVIKVIWSSIGTASAIQAMRNEEK